MIRCLHDSMKIDFPRVHATLEECAKRFIAKWLPQIDRETPKAVSDYLSQHRQDGLSPERRAAAQRAAGDGVLGAWFTQRVRQRVAAHRPCLTIRFMRTLRIPDDGQLHSLPAGLGSFPLRPIQLHAKRVPEKWRERGGVLMPMYQAEALWLDFHSKYPIALRVGTGMINAITGEPWQKASQAVTQDYVVLPEQPWLDGYCVRKGVIRQFVAAPLGKGYTAEEQLQGTFEGGIQFAACPLDPQLYFDRELQDELPRTAASVLTSYLKQYLVTDEDCIRYSLCEAPMGLGLGGQMQQDIYVDPWPREGWQTDQSQGVWVHLCNALQWQAITGELPPQKPITASEYARNGFPWFDYYRDDLKALNGGSVLTKLKTVLAKGRQSGDKSLPEDEAILPGPIVALGPDAPEDAVIPWNGR